MKTWVRKTLSAGVLAAGALLLAPGAAHADADQTAKHNSGLGTGNNTYTEVLVPVNAAANSAGILGDSWSAGTAANVVEGVTGVKQHTGKNRGALTGNNTYVAVLAPINAIADSAAVGGSSQAAGTGVNHVESGDAGQTTENGEAGQATRNNRGLLSGNNIAAPIVAPINACANNLALLGSAQSQAGCVNVVGGGGDSQTVGASTNTVESGEQGAGGESGQTTRNNRGFLSGNNVSVPVTIPVNACGNALAVFGSAEAAAACANGVDSTAGDQADDHGDVAGDSGADVAGDSGANEGDHLGNDGGQAADKASGGSARETGATEKILTNAGGLTQGLTDAGGNGPAGGLTQGVTNAGGDSPAGGLSSVGGNGLVGGLLGGIRAGG